MPAVHVRSGEEPPQVASRDAMGSRSPEGVSEEKDGGSAHFEIPQRAEARGLDHGGQAGDRLITTAEGELGFGVSNQLAQLVDARGPEGLETLGSEGCVISTQHRASVVHVRGTRLHESGR
jgi:hypothetical protein